MSKSTLLALALLGAAGYFVADNWDEIRVKLGIDEPTELRALNLAKSDFTLARHLPNHKVLDDIMKEARNVEVIGWQTEQRTDRLYLVKFLYRQNGEPGGYYFEVDVAKLTVRNIEAYTNLAKSYGVQPSAPR